ncbi:hypothetical protein ACFY72_30300 [Streptomyces globisporus]|uniref:hypothetical protein n=1 Tax=Streptomyces albovinaceus subgroup TaxID=1482558 RepID=UPI000E2CAC12|nr:MULTISPECIES: hypothetical protein [Streptomyces]RDL10341.1 hypothetical protein DER30_3833 [Streptomyces sp. HB202]WSU82585.1 hypothetical protein OG215_19140 [Streptomyces globisporus]
MPAEPLGAGGPAEPTAAPVRRRPRGRTTLIIAAAALLGIVGGVAVGYGVQAEREPTPLAALSQPGLGYPAKPGAADRAPAPLPAAQDRRVKTDGDLRKLLVDRPKGAKKTLIDELGLGDGWEPIDQYAEMNFEDPHYMFEALAERGLRRVASASWDQGKYRNTEVHLLQFRSGDVLGAAEHVDEQMMYMPLGKRGAGNTGDAIKGSREGRYFLYPVEREAGYLPFYRARALAVRGDIALDISISDSSPISKKDIRTLAERQLERL